MRGLDRQTDRPAAEDEAGRGAGAVQGAGGGEDTYLGREQQAALQDQGWCATYLLKRLPPLMHGVCGSPA